MEATRHCQCVQARSRCSRRIAACDRHTRDHLAGAEPGRRLRHGHRRIRFFRSKQVRHADRGCNLPYGHRAADDHANAHAGTSDRDPDPDRRLGASDARSDAASARIENAGGAANIAPIKKPPSGKGEIAMSMTARPFKRAALLAALILGRRASCARAAGAGPGWRLWPQQRRGAARAGNKEQGVATAVATIAATPVPPTATPAPPTGNARAAHCHARPAYAATCANTTVSSR